MNKKRPRLSLAGALLAAPWIVPASAAEAPTPGEVQETLDRPKPPPSVESPKVQTPASPRTRVKAGGRKVLVETFQIQGNTVFTDEKLLSKVQEWQGKELTLQEIYHVSDVLTEFYHDQGYSLTTVTVPAQKVQDGSIRLQVIEGRVSKLKFQGNDDYSSAFLTAQMDRLAPGTIVQRQDLEHEMLLLDDLPGLTARAVIEPGQQFGTSDIVVKTKETRYQGELTVDNHGSEVIGEWRLGGHVQVNNLSGNGDYLQAGYTLTESGLLDNLELEYDSLYGVNGTRVGARYSHVTYDVGGPFSALGISGETDTLRLQSSYPLVRGRERSIVLGLAVSHQESEVESQGSVVSESQLNLLEASASMSFVHPDRSVSTLSALAGTNFRSNPDGLADNRQAGKLELDATHQRPLSRPWSLYLRGMAVLSIDPLVDAQKFSLGGPRSVRGYTSSAARGDRGGLLTVEARRAFAWAGKPGSFRVFSDLGTVTRLAPATGENGSETLSSIGLGLTYRPAPATDLDLQWARATSDPEPADDRNDGHLWAKLRVGF